MSKFQKSVYSVDAVRLFFAFGALFLVVAVLYFYQIRYVMLVCFREHLTIMKLTKA